MPHFVSNSVLATYMPPDPNHRIAGLLVPAWALRGTEDLGIGDTRAVCEFVDWADDRGVRCVQLLPIGETGPDHSPYNAISSRALEPALLHMHPDWVPGLTPHDLKNVANPDGNKSEEKTRVDYDTVKPLKQSLLQSAFEHFKCAEDHPGESLHRLRSEFEEFCKLEEAWLDDYSLFRLLAEISEQPEWDIWPLHYRTAASARVWLAERTSEKKLVLGRRREYFCFVQWVADRQWRRVKEHAASKGVWLMGDVPFGIALASADVWAQPHLFQSDCYCGAPPELEFRDDAFVCQWGQNWGFPMYDWQELKKQEFRWWRARISSSLRYFDLLRLDHILGFFRIYGFPWRPCRNSEFVDIPTALAMERAFGRLPGFMPRDDVSVESRGRNHQEGKELLQQVLNGVPPGVVVGEDLGIVPDYVRPCLKELGIAGYKIPQWEVLGPGQFCPGTHYPRRSVATYGTHDHLPLRCWWENLMMMRETDAHAQSTLRGLEEFASTALSPSGHYSMELHRALLRALMHCNSWLVMVSVTDVFARTERFNHPGVTSSINWTLRMHKEIRSLDDDPCSLVLQEVICDERPWVI
jgi:4-alpha-glucanotransferase